MKKFDGLIENYATRIIQSQAAEIEELNQQLELAFLRIEELEAERDSALEQLEEDA